MSLTTYRQGRPESEYYPRNRVIDTSHNQINREVDKMGIFGSTRGGDDVKAVLGEDGKTDNYFGGSGEEADSKGHGHIAVTEEDGDVKYAREAEQHMPDSSRSDRVSVDEPD
jgi:hypothetical protein